MSSFLVTGSRSLALAACCSLTAFAAPAGAGEQVATVPRMSEAVAPAVVSAEGSPALVRPIPPATVTPDGRKPTFAGTPRPAGDDPGLVLLLMLHQLGPLPYLER
jgi:hypothetical protein